MKLRQKIAGIFMAAVTALSALSVTAFATDPVGSGNPTVLKDGVEATEQIKYDSSMDYDNGHNYADFVYTAPADGTLVINYDIAVDFSGFNVYKGKTKQEMSSETCDVLTGRIQSFWGNTQDDNAGLFAAELTYKVEKGEDYFIRVSRAFPHAVGGTFTGGQAGNGRVHITAEMKKPDVPSGVKVSTKTDTSFTLTWAEPDEADAYDIRYKASSAKSWTTVEDIQDNKATINKLKGGTKYSYCIRSKAGEIVGEWSKAASVTTDDPKNVKIAAPTVNNAKLTAEISWKAVKNATGYNVKYSTDKKNWTTVKVTETSCYIPVAAGKTYYYAVQGKNSAKTGSWSATKSIKIG